MLGYGAIPSNHYGLPNNLQIDRQDHRKMHKYPLTDEELALGYTRLMQLHFDGSLYSVPPPFCGSLLAVRTPKGPDLTLRFDNVNGRGEKKMAPGSTACRSVLVGGAEGTLTDATADFNAAMAYRLLTPEQQEIANHSTVTYAPHALCALFALWFRPRALTLTSQLVDRWDQVYLGRQQRRH